MSLTDCDKTFDIQTEVQQQIVSIHYQTENYLSIKLSQEIPICVDQDKQKNFLNDDYQNYHNSSTLSCKKTSFYNDELTGEYQFHFDQSDLMSYYNYDNIQPNQNLTANQAFKNSQDFVFSSPLGNDQPVSQDNYQNQDFYQNKYYCQQEEEEKIFFNHDQECVNQLQFNVDFDSLNEENFILQNNCSDNNQQCKNTPFIIKYEAENFSQISQNQFISAGQAFSSEQIKNSQSEYFSFGHCFQDINENHNNNQRISEITEVNSNLLINFEKGQEFIDNNFQNLNNLDDYQSLENKQQQPQITHDHEQSSIQNQLNNYEDNQFPQFQIIKTNRKNTLEQLPFDQINGKTQTTFNQKDIQNIMDFYSPQILNISGLENVQKFVIRLCYEFRPYFPDDFDRLNQKQSDPFIEKVICFIRRVVVNHYKTLGVPMLQYDKPNRQTHCMCQLDKQYKLLSGLQNHIKSNHCKTPVWVWSVKINEKVGRRRENLPEDLLKDNKKPQKQSYAQKAKNYQLSKFGQLVIYKRNNQM
ncbi:hypothetical protein ABPG72_015606 [Tetrahymena utriculariae]